MTKTVSRGAILLARFVILLLIILIILGLVRYGLSAEVRQRFWQDILARPGGAMTFRFILQPAMATIAALRDGVKDARMRRSPYVWTILTNREERSGLLWEGLLSTARIILLGLVMDTIYQFIVFKAFFPGQAAIVAISLAFFPYLLLRGPIARIALWYHGDA